MLSLGVLQVIEVEVQFNISDRRDTSRRYLRIDCKWSLGVEQVMEVCRVKREEEQE